MDNLADLEKAYRVPCKHCAEQMQAWDLFCPSCGKDQTAAKAAAPPAPPAQPPAEPEPVALLAPSAPATAEAPMPALLPPQGGSSTTRARILIGIGAVVLVLLGAVLAHDHFYVDQQPQQQPAEDARLRDFKANVGQLQGALNRDDLQTAERLLDVLEARHLSDPIVQELRMAFDRRAQAQAALKAPVVATPAPPIDMAQPKEKVCNETLAALALCPNR